MNYALTSFDYAPQAEEKIAQFIGPPLEEAMEALTDSSSSYHIDELVAKYRERYFEIGYAENKLYPNIVEMLSRLHESNIFMGVCTSKYQTIAEKILQQFEIDRFFGFINGPLEKKEKATQLKELLDENTITKNSIMIGDRYVDLTAAKKNSLRNAGVLWGYGDLKELSAERPNYIFSNPMELASTFIED